MRIAIVTLASLASVGLSACVFAEDDPPEPEISIVSPTTGTTVDHHDPIIMQVEVTGGVPVTEIQLLVDGVADDTFAITPRPDGQYCDACSFRIVWPATNVTEGTHVVQVTALQDRLGTPRNGDAIEMIFDDKPQIEAIEPAANADLLGVGMVNVSLSVRERGQATATLAIDGVTMDPKTSDDCRATACELAWEWDTTQAASGAHTLEFVVSDGHSHTVREMRTAYVDDVVKITKLEVTGIDEQPTMEIEVYLFDDTTNELLGCAGSAHGLLDVDHPDIEYSVDARLISAAGTPLHGSDIASRTLRFEVWEDDDVPVCPQPVSPAGNNLVGKSVGASYAEWKSRSTPAAFGMVVELGTFFGRPLEQ